MPRDFGGQAAGSSAHYTDSLAQCPEAQRLDRPPAHGIDLGPGATDQPREPKAGGPQPGHLDDAVMAPQQDVSRVGIDAFIDRVAGLLTTGVITATESLRAFS